MFKSPLEMEGIYNALERHCGVHGDKARYGADSEGDTARQGLPRVSAALNELLEGGVRRESDG